MSVVLAEDDVDIRDLVQIVLEGLDLEVRRTVRERSTSRPDHLQEDTA